MAELNHNQRLVLGAGIALFALALLFPPFEWRGNGRIANAGYAFLFAPPDGSITPYVNLPLLAAEWIAIVVVCGGLLVLLRPSKP